jgi:lipopolysaccharide export system protein LptA
VVTVERTTQLARRRKLIAGVVAGALGVTVIAIALAYWRSSRREESPLQVPRTLPKEINQQLSGYTFTRSDEGRQVFTVHAARTVAFQEGGTTVLEDVFVEVFGRTGQRRDILRTRRCDYNATSGDLFSSGTVEIELNAPAEGGTTERGERSVHLETSKLSFRQQGSLVVSEEPVRFRIGPASGSAIGMAYATREGWLEFKKDVSAELPLRAGAEASLPVLLSASSARYHKVRGEIELRGPVEFTQASRRVVAERGTVYLDEENRIRRAVLEEGARAFDSSEGGALEGAAQRLMADFDPPSGEVRRVVAEGAVTMTSKRKVSVGRLEAQRVEVSFEGEQPRAQRGIASGDVRLSIDPPRTAGKVGVSGTISSQGRRELTAKEVEFEFQPEGRSLASARTVGAGRLVLVPIDPKVGRRVITAGQFLMAFGPRNGLERVRGVSGTEISFFPPRGAAKGEPATSSSERLEAVFDPATQEVRILRQLENFRFSDGDRQASAEQAKYVSSNESLTLTGAPQLRDPSTRILAELVTFDLRTDTAEGLGKVRSTHFEDRGRPDAGSRGEPTNVIADRVVVKRKSEFLHYQGNVRVWRGADVVESSSLDVYRAERRVSSGFGVRTSHLQSASRGSGALSAGTQGEKRPVTIRADRLEYFDQGRKASYRGNVRLQAENTTLEADRVNVYFLGGAGAEGAEVDRAVADGRVKVRQPMRRAAGDRAEYFAAEGRILLTGGPPTLHDEEKGFTTGQRLTFFIRDDTLLVDGGDKSPTVSKHRIAQ